MCSSHGALSTAASRRVGTQGRQKGRTDFPCCTVCGSVCPAAPCGSVPQTRPRMLCPKQTVQVSVRFKQQFRWQPTMEKVTPSRHHPHENKQRDWGFAVCLQQMLKRGMMISAVYLAQCPCDSLLCFWRSLTNVALHSHVGDKVGTFTFFLLKK